MLDILHLFDFIVFFRNQLRHYAPAQFQARALATLFADAESEICFNFSALRLIWGLYGGSENSVKFVTWFSKNLLRFVGHPSSGFLANHKAQAGDPQRPCVFLRRPPSIWFGNLVVPSVIDVNLVFCKPWYEAMTRYLLCVCLSQIHRLLLHHMLTTVDSHGVSAIVNT